ncbi:MAG: Rrf2 family transcriptional regulator [Planctomycetales bacterium]|nr:Rrf2 family transcriptional regulator [Planctomycetales bacterium]
MDIIRRDTDYAFRIAVVLAQGYESGATFSARKLASQTCVSYPLTCKILQKLVKYGVTQSSMGPKGGFRLAANPKNICFGQVVAALQGPVCVNKCLLGDFHCSLKQNCPARPKLARLQMQINDYLNELTLQDILRGEPTNG